MNKLLRAKLLAGVAGLGLGSLLIHPFGAVKARASVDPLLAGAEVDPAIVQIVERSCQNCHSEKTQWPWYSYVPPVSWLVENDVHNARRHMNLSRWGEYSLKEKQELLTKLAAAVRSHQMPPARYTLMHPGAKPSQTDREYLYQWARGERRRLKSAAGAQSATSSDAAPSQ